VYSHQYVRARPFWSVVVISHTHIKMKRNVTWLLHSVTGSHVGYCTK